MKKLISISLLWILFISGCTKTFKEVKIYAVYALIGSKKQEVITLKKGMSIQFNKATTGWECRVATLEDEPLEYYMTCTNWNSGSPEVFNYNQKCHSEKATIKVSAAMSKKDSLGIMEFSFICD